MEVGAWVYKHFDEVSGISFLPHSDHSYKQAPYQEVSKEEYEDLLSRMPKEIRWEDLSFYETEELVIFVGYGFDIITTAFIAIEVG